MIYKTLLIKVKMKQHEPHLKWEVNSGFTEGLTVSSSTNISNIYLLYSDYIIYICVHYFQLLQEGSCQSDVFCVCLHIVVSNTQYVVFFFDLFTLCCHFLWIVHFSLSLRYSLALTYLCTRSFISALYLLTSDSMCLFFISSLYKTRKSFLNTLDTNYSKGT